MGWCRWAASQWDHVMKKQANLRWDQERKERRSNPIVVEKKVCHVEDWRWFLFFLLYNSPKPKSITRLIGLPNNIFFVGFVKGFPGISIIRKSDLQRRKEALGKLRRRHPARGISVSQSQLVVSPPSCSASWCIYLFLRDAAVIADFLSASIPVSFAFTLPDDLA